MALASGHANYLLFLIWRCETQVNKILLMKLYDQQNNCHRR